MSTDGIPTITAGGFSQTDANNQHADNLIDIIPGPDGFMLVFSDNVNWRTGYVPNTNLGTNALLRSLCWQPVGGNVILGGIFYNNRWVVIIGDGSATTQIGYCYGPDPINGSYTGWTVVTGNGAGWFNSYSSLQCLDDGLVYINSGGATDCWKSADGISWTRITNTISMDSVWVGPYSNTSGVKMKNAIFSIYGGSSYTALLDITGNAFYRVGDNSTYNQNRLCGMTYGAGVYVMAYGCGLFSSTDKKTWTFRWGHTFPSVVTGVFFLNGNFIAVGNSGLLLTSSDGITWTTRTSGLTSHLMTADYVNGIYVIAGSYTPNNLAYSSNLTSWTTKTVASSNITRIAHIGNRFVVSLDGDVPYYSDNGSTWTASTGYGQAAHTVYNDGTQLIVANRTYIGTSTDGATFTNQIANLPWTDSPLPVADASRVRVSDIFKANGNWYFWVTLDGPFNAFGPSGHQGVLMMKTSQLNSLAGYQPYPIGLSSVAFADYGIGQISLVNGIPTLLFPWGYYEFFNSTPSWVGTRNKAEQPGQVGYVRIA
jgi:hypothetical protein